MRIFRASGGFAKCKPRMIGFLFLSRTFQWTAKIYICIQIPSGIGNRHQGGFENLIFVRVDLGNFSESGRGRPSRAKVKKE